MPNRRERCVNTNVKGMNEVKPSIDQSESVPALRRAVRVLDFVGNSELAPSAADITRTLGLPKSTAHGLIGAMVEEGLLSRTPSNAFRLGPALLRWAGKFVSDQDLVGEFRQHMAEAPTLDRYTITLSMLDGPDVVYVACRNSSAPLGFTFRMGMRLPAAFTATGKAILSTMPDSIVADLYSTFWPKALTARSAPNLEALSEGLKTTRQRGYSIDDGEIREGMVCVGASVRDATGNTVGGVAVSMLESEATPDTVERIGATLINLGSALSRRLGSIE